VWICSWDSTLYVTHGVLVPVKGYVG